MKKLMIVFATALFFASCGGDDSSKETKSTTSTESKSEDDDKDDDDSKNPSYDPNRGEGKFTNVEVSPNLDVAKAEAGEKVYTVKCAGCHKLTDEKLVGPGWMDITKRFTAEWIMNFSTNTDVMLDKDPRAQAQLEICLVRMPNQNLTDDDARNVYEFMRKNDGVK